MKALIDISIFLEAGGAFGNVAGEMDFALMPQVGDKISFICQGSQAFAGTGFAGTASRAASGLHMGMRYVQPSKLDVNMMLNFCIS